MKKLMILAAAALLTVSCSDDDGDSTGNVSVNGTWNLTAFTTNEAADINNDGTASTNFIAESGCYGNSSIVFANENSAIFNLEELDIELDLVIGTEDSYEYSIDCIGAEPEVGMYTVSDNSVSVVFDYGDGETETAIFARSGNTLTVTIPELVDVPVEDNGDITYSFVGATLVFTKQ
ncbi:lipocalin family protein [Flavobacterium litorale]|uniref:Lipocalin family protein n=1 Tax=Flavobacterium litorale TaxID=2856519 RepID=A0ABX8V991_9FLAO|nr:lipocalin family protein [Flavobacterium litorale]QYJ69420.1 lipocalin family protein [Flavobacterium litorale]